MCLGNERLLSVYSYIKRKFPHSGAVPEWKQHQQLQQPTSTVDADADNIAAEFKQEDCGHGPATETRGSRLILRAVKKYLEINKKYEYCKKSWGQSTTHSNTHCEFQAFGFYCMDELT